MHILSRHTLLLLLAPLLLLPSCSETKHLAEGETLYTGIEDISWDGAPKRYKRGGAEPDSAGVITSIAGAIDAVGNVLDGITAGGTSDDTPATNGGSQPLTPGQQYCSPALLHSGDSLLPRYLARIEQALTLTLEGIGRASDPAAREKQSYYRAALDEVREMQRLLPRWR